MIKCIFNREFSTDKCVLCEERHICYYERGKKDERERIIREYEEAVSADNLSMTHGDIFPHNADDFWKMLKENT